ncbi:hypothetical protein EVJ29_15175 [Exiguobacterium sp. SH4S7]|uniref:hypothetical protein n=1 Tax=Exiguobacterium sp. SH4S7 TaxID=2510958 RepID=UPI00103C6B03|nr:hypothetical protein [Exiguobacterium sp. SH4S7]TCI32752.1 hypothetical protein EVJ29_15175 [Exiguobacterium sp. SH4S7]
MDKVVELLVKSVGIIDKADPVLTIVLAGLNIWIVYRVYKFTQKMSQSKLSLSPEFTATVFERLKRDDKLDYDEEFYIDLDFIGEGFPLENCHHGEETLSIKLKNRGDLPSTDIKILLELKVYKTQIEYDPQNLDSLDVIGEKKELHTTKEFVITKGYMGADEEHLFKLVGIYGQFRESELILKEIKANGHVYFKEKTLNGSPKQAVIHHYKHPSLNISTGNSQKEASFYGHRLLWEESENLKREEEEFARGSGW